MKRVIIEEPGKVEIQDVPDIGAEPGHALLKVLYGGICGSDMGTYNGTFLYSKYPRVPGHEFSAEVVEVDESNPYGIKKGMIVTGNPYFNCGTCYSCRRGFVNCCTSNQTLGAQRDGIFQQYFSMPLERIYDGKGLSPKTLAAIEPFCIGYHAVKRAGIRKGEKVLVVGAGTIGYLTAMAAKMMGGEVYVCDISQDKLDFAAGLGIAGTILNTGDEAFKEAVQRATDGDGFDVCMEAVGMPSTFQNCIDAAAYRARVVVIGVGKKSLDFFYTTIQTKELNIFGSRNAEKADFLELIDFVKAGKADLDRIVSAVYPYTEAEKAFADLKEHGGSLVKVMLKFA